LSRLFQQTLADKKFGIAILAEGCYVDSRATIVGTVIIESGVYVAPGVVLRADASAPYIICRGSNVQDGVILHASEGKLREVQGKKYANYIGPRCSLAHGARVHHVVMAENCFLGLGSTLLNVTLGENCFIGSHSLVENIDIPAGRFVPPFTYVGPDYDISSLPEVPPEAAAFQAHVLEENRGILKRNLAEEADCV
jgi:carbon dioxide concentrating mechanism protein CcmM